jgi:hypothetical protein
MPAVTSTAILAIDHDARTETMKVRFITGRLYAYAGVPRDEYEAFLAAPSKGEYFNAHIRDHYSYEELD